MNMKLFLRWLASTATLLALANYLPGIVVNSFYNALIAALILGFVNALIRPLLLVLTLPVNILTLGFFTLVINACLFWFVSTVVQGFEVVGFMSAFWGALGMWVVSFLVNYLLSDKK